MNIGFLFDLDGVLIDSEREYTKIWKVINETFPTGIPDFELKIKGQTLKKILSENFPEEQHEDVKKLLHRLEREMRYSYCPHAEQFLKYLQESDESTAVVTSSDEVKMAHLYQDLPEFRSKIKIVVDASQVKKSKPDPEGYLLAAQKLGLDIKKCAVFEDSVQGVMAGRAAGAYVVGITGTKTREELLPFADVVVDSLAQIDKEDLKKRLETR